MDISQNDLCYNEELDRYTSSLFSGCKVPITTLKQFNDCNDLYVIDYGFSSMFGHIGSSNPQKQRQEWSMSKVKSTEEYEAKYDISIKLTVLNCIERNALWATITKLRKDDVFSNITMPLETKANRLLLFAKRNIDKRDKTIDSLNKECEYLKKKSELYKKECTLLKKERKMRRLKKY